MIFRQLTRKILIKAINSQTIPCFFCVQDTKKKLYVCKKKKIKYVKEGDGRKKALIESKKAEAIEQLQSYKDSNLFKDRTDVRYLAVVFIGKKNYLIEEI